LELEAGEPLERARARHGGTGHRSAGAEAGQQVIAHRPGPGLDHREEVAKLAIVEHVLGTLAGGTADSQIFQLELAATPDRRFGIDGKTVHADRALAVLAAERPEPGLYQLSKVEKVEVQTKALAVGSGFQRGEDFQRAEMEAVLFKAGK